jgi:hypothetical protein
MPKLLLLEWNSILMIQTGRQGIPGIERKIKLNFRSISRNSGVNLRANLVIPFFQIISIFFKKK